MKNPLQTPCTRARGRQVWQRPGQEPGAHGAVVVEAGRGRCANVAGRVKRQEADEGGYGCKPPSPALRKAKAMLEEALAAM